MLLKLQNARKWFRKLIVKGYVYLSFGRYKKRISRAQFLYLLGEEEFQGRRVGRDTFKEGRNVG